MEMQWNKTVKQALEKLISKKRTEPCYAVFDWDNTSIFHDIGTAVFIRQLETLYFGLNPEAFDTIMQETLTLSGNDMSSDVQQRFAKEMAELVVLYRTLYEASETLGGTHPIEEMQNTAAYADFRVRMYRLYQDIGAVFSTNVSYPWVTYFLAGLTSEEVQKFSQKTIEQTLTQPLTSQIWQGSTEAVGTVQVPSGIRIFPEMKQLYQQLMRNGIDVYICSASQHDIVVPFAQSYGIPTNYVFGMRLVSDENGVLTPKLDDTYPLTQAQGKVTTIRQLIAPNYQGDGPVLVGGDSSGDAAMLSTFPATEVALIIERQTTGEIEGLRELARKTAGTANQRYYLQKRDETTGRFISS